MFHSDNGPEEMLLMFRSKELAQLKNSEFHTPLPLIRVKMTVYGDDPFVS